MLELLAEAADGRLRVDGLAGRRRNDVDDELPAPARLQLDRVRRPRALHRVGRLREDHLRRVVAVVVREEELPRLGVECRLDELRQRRRVERIAEREVVRLHGEDVREVRADLERDLKRDRVHALVHDRDPVLHRVADEARACDPERVLRQRLRGRVAQEEGRRVVLDLVGREQQRLPAVDRQPEDGEVPGVVGEEAARLVPEVAPLVADAERRPLEDGQRHGREATPVIRHDAWPKTRNGMSDARRSTPERKATTTRGPWRSRRCSTTSSSWPASSREHACSRSAAAPARPRCPLAERGFSILAVELGANLAELARRKLAAYPEVEIVTSSFEDWDPGRRALRRRRLLQRVPLDRPRRPVLEAGVRAAAGRLARRVRLGLRRPRRGRPDVARGVRVRSRHGWLRATAPRRQSATGRTRSRRAGTSAPSPEGRTSAISRTAPTTTSRCVGTMSAHRALEDDVREELFERMRRRIEEGGGSVTPTRLDVLYVARRA